MCAGVGPTMLFLKDRDGSMKVGIGMVSRSEVGLIVAGIEVTSSVLSGDIYTAAILMVAITTIITPTGYSVATRKMRSKHPRYNLLPINYGQTSIDYCQYHTLQSCQLSVSDAMHQQQLHYVHHNSFLLQLRS